jgi:DNA-binding NarL/FixJ family response regulator
MAALILIIGPEGRLREGLCIVLRTFPGIADLILTDSLDSGCELVVRHKPSLVIVDADDKLEEECQSLKRVLASYAASRCLVIAKSLAQAAKAKEAGADAILLQGFSTNTLYQTLVSLEVIPESRSTRDPAMIKKRQVLPFQPAQKL